MGDPRRPGASVGADEARRVPGETESVEHGAMARGMDHEQTDEKIWCRSRKNSLTGWVRVRLKYSSLPTRPNGSTAVPNSGIVGSAGEKLADPVRSKIQRSGSRDSDLISELRPAYPSPVAFERQANHSVRRNLAGCVV